MNQQLNAITIAAKDVVKLKKFYCEVFKWTVLTENESVVMFSLKSAVLTLYDKTLFNAYSGNTGNLKGRGVYFTINLSSLNEVDETLLGLEASGVEIIKPAEQTFWGGYAGFVADPENNVWEICYNPFPATWA